MLESFSKYSYQQIREDETHNTNSQSCHPYISLWVTTHQQVLDVPQKEKMPRVHTQRNHTYTRNEMIHLAFTIQ